MVAACGTLVAFVVGWADPPPARVAIGMVGRVSQVVLPAPELEPVPLDRKAPVVVRIAEVYKHGTDYRYDLEFEALEPGTYDLTKFLRRKDGKPHQGLPAIPVVAEARLAKEAFTPHEVKLDDSPTLGGYRTLIVVVAAVWLLGLVYILSLGKKSDGAAVAEVAAPKTLAERLQPLVERALAGKLGLEEQAALERTLLAYWRRRLQLEASEPGAALVQLRSHPEAGALLRQLDAWLHVPPADRPKEVDTQALLAPYRHVRAEELDAAMAGGRA